MTFSKIQIHLNASRCGFTRESIHFHVQYSPGKSQLRTSTEHHHGAELLPDQLVGEKKKKKVSQNGWHLAIFELWYFD